MQEKEEILCTKEAFFTLPIQQSNSDPNVKDVFLREETTMDFTICIPL